MLNPTQEPDPNAQISALSRRIARLEGEFAGSWAAQTREEYEARMRGEMRNEVREFMIKFAIGATIFLAGAGYTFIVSQTKATFHDEAAASNEFIRGEMRSQFQSALAAQRKTEEYMALHNVGVFYRYALDYRYGTKKDLSDAQAFGEMIEKVRAAFLKAYEKAPNEVSTLWELGNLYYFTPLKSDPDHPVDAAKARRYYEDAVKHYQPEQIQQGYRADTYHKLGTIIYKESEAAKDSHEQEEAATQASEYWSMALDDFLKSDINDEPWVKTQIDDLKRHLHDELPKKLICALLPQPVTD